MTEIFVEHRWAGPLAWLVLHTLDYYLTLWSVALHRSGADGSFDVGGSLELNPIMRGALERRRWISLRFLVTLIGIGTILWGIFPLAKEEDESLWPFLLGTIIFTRLSVIGHHVHNIVFLRAIVSGQVKGRMEYSRQKVLELSVLRYGAEVLTLVVAALLSGSAWLWGGVVGLGALVLALLLRVIWEWFRRARRSG